MQPPRHSYNTQIKDGLAITNRSDPLRQYRADLPFESGKSPKTPNRKNL